MNRWLSRAVCFVLLLAVGGPSVLLQAAPQAAAARLAIEPSKLDFGTLPLDGNSLTKTVTLENRSGSAVAISDILTSGIDFAETNTCGTTLAAGANCKIDVTFKPATSGPRLGTLNVYDSAPGSPHMIAIAGVGAER